MSNQKTTVKDFFDTYPKIPSLFKAIVKANHISEFQLKLILTFLKNKNIDIDITLKGNYIPHGCLRMTFDLRTEDPSHKSSKTKSKGYIAFYDVDLPLTKVDTDKEHSKENSQFFINDLLIQSAVILKRIEKDLVKPTVLVEDNDACLAVILDPHTCTELHDGIVLPYLGEELTTSLKQAIEDLPKLFKDTMFNITHAEAKKLNIDESVYQMLFDYASSINIDLTFKKQMPLNYACTFNLSYYVKDRKYNSILSSSVRATTELNKELLNQQAAYSSQQLHDDLVKHIQEVIIDTATESGTEFNKQMLNDTGFIKRLSKSNQSNNTKSTLDKINEANSMAEVAEIMENLGDDFDIAKSKKESLKRALKSFFIRLLKNVSVIFGSFVLLTIVASWFYPNISFYFTDINILKSFVIVLLSVFAYQLFRLITTGLSFINKLKQLTDK